MLELFNLDLEQFGAGLDAVPESAEKSPLPLERAEKQTVRDIARPGKCSDPKRIRGKPKEKSPQTLLFTAIGGDKRDRTADLLTASQTLSRNIGYAPPQNPTPTYVDIFTQL